jgi:hypothetical protein
MTLQEVDTAHLVVNSHGSSEGRFTFTSHEAGDHTICLATNASKSSTWFSSGSHVRLYLDVVVGSTKADVEHDRSHVSMLAGKVRELNAKLEEIRREQQYQREREADFRDLSESTNAKAVLYSIVQIGTLLATCFWQLRHLKVCPLEACVKTRQLTPALRPSVSLKSGGCKANMGGVNAIHLIYFRVRRSTMSKSHGDPSITSGVSSIRRMTFLPNPFAILSITSCTSAVICASLLCPASVMTSASVPCSLKARCQRHVDEGITSRGLPCPPQSFVSVDLQEPVAHPVNVSGTIWLARSRDS